MVEIVPERGTLVLRHLWSELQLLCLRTGSGVDMGWYTL
jgi:hypothetical protein